MIVLYKVAAMAAIFYFDSKFKEDHYESFEASGILNTFVEIKNKK